MYSPKETLELKARYRPDLVSEVQKQYLEQLRHQQSNTESQVNRLLQERTAEQEKDGQK